MNHLTLLQKGIESWNQWRDRHPNKVCDLEGQDLSHGYFFEGNFSGVNLKNANLQRACFVGANFRGADLSGADLSGAYLADANFYGANLSNANFSKADLDRADMREANLLGTQMNDVDLRHTKLPDASVSPYGYHVAALLAQTNASSSSQQNQSAQNQRIENPSSQKQSSPKQISTKQSAATTVKSASKTQAPEKSAIAQNTSKPSLKPSLWRESWNNGPLRLFSKETPEALVDRQQRIRLSAIPGPKKAAVTTHQSANDNTVKPNSVKKSSPQTPAQSVQNSSPPKASIRWGRRAADQTTRAKANRLIKQKVVFPATIAAAGLAFAIGWPTLTDTIASNNTLNRSTLNNEGNSQAVIAAEASSLALVKSLTGESQIWSLATQRLADGTTQVIAGNSNGDIQIWDSKTGATIRTLSGHGSGVKSLAVSRSGQWLVSSDRNELKVWNPSSGQLVHSLSIAGRATGNTIGDATDSSPIATVAIAPDDSAFISSTQSGRITAWDLASGTERYSLNNGSAVWSIAIAPNSQSFVSGNSDRTIHQRDLANGKLLQEFTGHTDAVRSVAISPDGQTLASGSWDQTIKLWNLATGDLQTTLSGHTDQIFSLAISPDGKTLASSSTDRTLKLWDLPNRALTKTLDDNTESVVTVAFAATEPLATDTTSNLSGNQTATPILVSGGRAQTVNIWQ